MLEILKFADARLREPSTWAGIATLLGVLHLSLNPGLWQAVTLWGTVGAAGLAILLSEVGSKPPVLVAEDVLAAVSIALKAASKPPALVAEDALAAVSIALKAPPLPAAPAELASAAPAPKAVAATVGLALLCAAAFGLVACSGGSAPDQKQALYTAESAYALIANDEATAIRTGAVPASAVAGIRQTDTTLYATLVAWRTSVEAGNPPAAGVVAAAQAGMQGLIGQLGGSGTLSGTAAQAADAALSLTAALIAGG